MSNLAQTVDRRVDQLGVVCSDHSESENESHPLQHSAANSAPSARPGTLKSGREAKATSEVLYPQRWPHSFLCLTQAQRKVKYEELTLAEFMAGYAQILLCKDISPLERTERKKHLVSLMYFAQQYEWSAILNFHGSILLEIEHGLVHWGDSSSFGKQNPLPAPTAGEIADFLFFSTSSILSRLSARTMR